MPQTKSVPTSTPKKRSPALPILFLLLTVGILGAGGFLVYKTINKSPGSPISLVQNLASGGNALMPKATESDFASISDPLIRKHFASQANSTSYRVTSTSSGRGDEDTQIMEFVLKGSEVTFRMAQNMDGKPYSDMITMGDTTYLKDMKDNSWWMQKAKPDAETKSNLLDKEIKVEDIKDEYMKKINVEYTKLGEEACGSLQCYKYQEVSDDNKEAKRIFWFDKKDLLLRREENGFGEFKSVSEYTYNVSIKTPSPVKQVPEGKNIYEYMLSSSSAGDSADLKDLDEVMNSPETEKLLKQFGGSNPASEPVTQEAMEDEGY